MIEFEHEGRRPFPGPPVGDLDLEDRLRGPGDRGPDAEDGKKPLGGQRQRIAPAVESRIGPKRSGLGVDEDDPKAA